MSSITCVDICDVVYGQLCITCPKNEECHGPRDQDNLDHEKMITCLSSIPEESWKNAQQTLESH